MTVCEQFATGEPLVIEHPPGGTRLIAAVWPAGDGLVFVDVGWRENDSSHPFHVVPGAITFDGFGWRCAPVDGEPVVIRPTWAWESGLPEAWDRWR